MFAEWLSRHRVAACTLALGYLATVTLIHDLMQRPAHAAQAQLGDRAWNIVVMGVALPLLAGSCVALGLRLRSHPRKWVAAPYLLASLVFAAICFFTLLQVNIEIVHFPQYAILGALLLLATGSYVEAMILGCAGGIIDEGYQYFCLHAHWGTYFDFNDVILNSVGVGMGLTALFILYPHRSPRRARRGILVGSALVAAAGLGLAYAGAIRRTPSEHPGNWPIELRRCPVAKDFWLTTDWGQTYHEVEPALGLGAVAVLILFYGALDPFHAQASCLRGGPNSRP